LAVAAPGQLIYSTTPTYNVTLNDYGFEQNYDYGTGTSASGPIVAGVAALMLSKHPSLSPDEVKSYIRKYVDPYDSTHYIGTGRINAYRATKNVKASFDTKSNSATLQVPIPRNKPLIFNFNLLSWLFERFPNAFPILRHMLGL
jgi:subtilisin family serine protease